MVDTYLASNHGDFSDPEQIKPSKRHRRTVTKVVSAPEPEVAESSDAQVETA